MRVSVCVCMFLFALSEFVRNYSPCLAFGDNSQRASTHHSIRCVCVCARELGSKARPARRADNLTAISEPIVKVMWDP
jgi:hypothetical protein